MVNKGNDLARSVAIGTSPAGTGAFSLGSGLAAVASKVTPIIAKVQAHAGPNTFVPLLESGELEFGIVNILDAHMAMTGTGTYKKLTRACVCSPAACFLSPAVSWCATNPTFAR